MCIRDSSSGAISFSNLNSSLGTDFNAFGFRRTDNFIYGLHPTTRELIRVDATGAIEILGVPQIPDDLVYLAGDVSPDGRFLTVIGSNGGNDKELFEIDLDSPTYTSQTTNLSNTMHLVDIAYHPITSVIYGYDSINKNVFRINLAGGTSTAFEPINTQFSAFDINSVYFDVYGKLYGFGTALGGTISGCLLYTSPSPRDATLSRMPSSA